MTGRALFIALFALACARQPGVPAAVVSAPARAHVRVRVQLDGSASTPAPVVAGELPIPITYRWQLLQKPAGSQAALDDPQAPAPRFTPDVDGTYRVQLVVNDLAHESAPAVAAIEASSDCAPAVTSAAGSSASVNVAQPLSLSASAQSACNDPAAGVGGDPIVQWRWSVQSAPHGSEAHVLGFDRPAASFVPDLRGDYVLGLQVTDALGFNSPVRTVAVTANACGDNAPQVAALDATPAAPNLAAPVRLSATVADADQACGLTRTLSYAWSLVAVPSGSTAALNAATAQVPSFAPDVPGDYVVALTVSDELGRTSARATTTVHASACGGGVPVVTAAAAPSSIATGDAAQLNLIVQNPDEAPACGLAVTYRYEWTAVAAPPGAVGALNDPGLSNPSFVAQAPGTYVFSVVAHASTGRSSAPATVSVQVDPCGSVRPVATIAAVSGATGLPLALRATVTDRNGCKQTAPWAYRWSLLTAPAGSTAQLSGAGPDGVSAQAVPSLVPDVDGTWAVTLVVTDALGLASAPAVQQIAVARCNAPPTAVISVASGAVTGAPVQASARVTDPNDPAANQSCLAPVAPFAFRWTLSGQPAGSAARLNNAAASGPSFVPDVSGAYTLQLVVSDAAGNVSAPVVATVSVADCSAPLSVVVPDVSGPTGQPVVVSADVTDPNAACAATAPIAWRWSISSAPQGSRAQLNNPLAAQPSFVPDVAGTYQVSVVATDAAGNASPATAGNVTVSDCSAPPTVSILAPAGAQTGSAVVLDASVADTNACGATAPFTWAWTLAGRPQGSAAALNSPFAAKPSFTPDVPGTYSLSLTVKDALGNASAPASATVSAAQCSAPLTVALAGNNGATLASLPLTATLTEPNAGCGATAPYTFTFALQSAPAGSAAAPDQTLVTSSAASAGSSFTPDVPGTYVFTVAATDALGNSGAATHAVVVSGCGGITSVDVSASPSAPQTGQPARLAATIADPGAAACGVPSVAPFSYQWSLTTPAASRAQLSSIAAAQPTFSPDVLGNYGYAVVVTDALGYRGVSPVRTANVTVDCGFTAQIAPVASGQLTYGTVALSGSITRNNPACTTGVRYLWSFDQKPVGSTAVFDDAAVANPSFVADVPNATFVARLTATDTVSGQQATATVTVTTNACGAQPPQAAAGISLPFPISVNKPQPDPNVGSTVQYLLSTPRYQLQLDGSQSSDPSAACTGPLAYQWSTYKVPTGSTARLYPATAARPSFVPDVQGDYIFQLVVSDGRFQSAPSFLRITVTNPLGDAVAPVNSGVLWNDAVADPSTGNPTIAFYQLNTGTNRYDLHYVRCTANCNTASPTWAALETIDTSLLGPNDTEVATAQVSLKYLPSTGQAAVAYRDSGNCVVKYAVRGAGGWALAAVENIGIGCTGIHGEVDLIFVGANQTPALAYHSHAGANAPVARYAVCTGNCTTPATTTWAFQNAEVTPNGTQLNPGHWMTTFVDPVSKLPRMAYHADGDLSLHYATCSGNCDKGAGGVAQGTWSHAVIDAPAGATTDVGYWNSLAVSPAGIPGIAYQSLTSGSTGIVRLATCTGNCGTGASSTWSFTNVATPAAGEYFTHLQYDAAGQAHITYIDSAAQILRYAIQIGSTNNFQRFDIDTGVDDGHSSFILTPAGSTHVSYALTTGLKYYPFGD